MEYQYNYSIIIPYRDTYDLLQVAINSIPDRSDIQIIIVDNSLQPIAQEKVPKKNQANVVFTTSSPTQGGGHARNVGLGLASGKFLLFLDADDYFINNAFDVFDTYLQKDYDIVFFKADSIKLENGEQSNRHKTIEENIDNFMATNNEDYLRYLFANPVCKLIKNELVQHNQIQFEEVKCSNDVMFSVRSGYLAKKVTADNTAVYMITEAPKGVSLTTNKSFENSFIRFQVTIRYYKFLKSIGRSDLKPRFFSYMMFALVHFGPKGFLKHLIYYLKNN